MNMSINTFIPAVNIANYCALQVLQRILHQTNFVERHFDFPVNFVNSDIPLVSGIRLGFDNINSLQGPTV